MIVYRETDELKAEEQMKCSSFVRLSYDPNFDHLAKVKVWAKKWCVAGEISKEWKYYIHTENARPDKNVTLCKTHKPGNPVRLLISGCNTAIKHLSPYIESICTQLTKGMPCRIKNTAH